MIIDPHHDLYYYIALWYLLPQEGPFSTFRLPTPGAAGWGGVSPLAVKELLPMPGRRKVIASFLRFRKKLGRGNITVDRFFVDLVMFFFFRREVLFRAVLYAFCVGDGAQHFRGLTGAFSWRCCTRVLWSLQQQEQQQQFHHFVKVSCPTFAASIPVSSCPFANVLIPTGAQRLL